MKERTITIDTKRVYLDLNDGIRCFDEEIALAVLLAESVCFTNTATFAPGADYASETVCCFVNCNDLFGGGADAESVRSDQLESLWWCYENHKDGSGLWCVLKRCRLPWSYKREKYESTLWDDWNLGDIVDLPDNWMEAFFKKRGVTLCEHQVY